MRMPHPLLILRFGLVLGVMGTSVLASAGAFTPPRAGAPVLVIAPPWSGGAAAILDRAGGREISPMRAPFAVLGVFEASVPSRLDGAWAVWDAGLLARLCGAGSADERSHENA